MILDKEGIKKIIPHREPMLMLDGVLEVESAKTIKAIKRFKGDEWFFQGHFPHNPILPGVLAVEAMAQAGAALVGYTLGDDFSSRNVYLMTINNVKFRKPVKPEHQLILEVEIAHRREPFWKFKGKAFRQKDENIELACEAEFMAMLEE